MINIIAKLKKLFESDKCMYCGETDSRWHNCFMEVLGYPTYEKFEVSSRIYFMRQKGLIK